VQIHGNGSKRKELDRQQAGPVVADLFMLTPEA
jgi:hypothetical protein